MTHSRRITMILAGTLVLALSLLSLPTLAQEKKPDATVEIVYAELALGASVSTARGKLHFQGETHEFEIGGLGLGGIGITEVKTTGQVYGLKKLEDFYGLYGKTSAAAAIGEGTTTISMTNGKDVLMEIKSDNEGLTLSLTASGVTVKELKQ